MKKLLLTCALLCCSAAYLAFAATSYDNNEYQRKSRAYSELAQNAYDEGDYDGAVEYAREAEMNAELSTAFIEKMLARASAEKALFQARTRLAWAKTEMRAEQFFPSAVSSAEQYIASADARFTAEEYTAAGSDAQLALDALAVVTKIVPLPGYYRVDLWDPSRDCFWNIAKNPAIYGDPLLWEKLYEANRADLKRPSDPNLLMPGMIMTIPSIKGEYREGTYDPSVKYDSFKSQTK